MKYLMLLFLIVTPLASNAASKMVESINDWIIVFEEDEITDKKSCTLISHITTTENNLSAIAFIWPVSIGVLSAAIYDLENGKILKIENGIGVDYRIDKRKPGFLGRKKNDASRLFILGEEYRQIVSALKKGTEAFFRVYTNRGNIGSVATISLMGFTKAYNLAEKCNYSFTS